MKSQENCIEIKSSTYAEKGEKLLRSKGISAKIVRMSGKENGCSRCIVVKKGDTERAVTILKANGVLLSGIVTDV